MNEKTTGASQDLSASPTPIVPRRNAASKAARAAAALSGATIPVKREYRGYIKSPGKLDKTSNMVESNMTDNTYFTEGDIKALVDALALARKDFSASWTLAKANRSDFNNNAVEVNAKRVVAAMDNLADYVEVNCNGDEAILRSSGFEPYASRRTRVPKPGAPDKVGLKIDQASKAVSLTCSSVGKNVFYTAYASTDNGENWTVVGGSSNSRNVPVKGLKSGVKYLLTISGQNADGEGPKNGTGVVWTAQ